MHAHDDKRVEKVFDRSLIHVSQKKNNPHSSFHLKGCKVVFGETYNIFGEQVMSARRRDG